MKMCAALVGALICIISAAPQIASADASATWQEQIDSVDIWITVMARGRDTPDQVGKEETWWQWGNTTTDAYLFAFGRPDDVYLIVEFDLRPDGLPQAKIYVNELGRLPLDYSLDGGELRVLSNSRFPYITLWPRSDTWYVGTQVNYNLTLMVDGPLPGESVMQGFGFETDGTADREIRVGTDRSGEAQWQTSQILHDPMPGRPQEGRFTASMRMQDAPAFKVAAPTMPTFPYLGLVGTNTNYFQQNRHPLQFRLHTSEFVVSPFTGLQSGVYNINSSSFPPDVDFEAPFAWYNFDPASRYPQLAIRAWYYPADSPVLSRYPLVIPGLSTFRYSWKTWDEQDWAYSISVAGPYAYDQLVEIGGVQFKGVPPEELPDWVISKSWPVTTFVEPVDGFHGGEGVYFYSTQRTELLRWFAGATDELPGYLAEPSLIDSIAQALYDPLPVGFRGEYNAASNRQPRLYVSPIDRRLHLLYAQGGVWNLGNGQMLRVHNLDGDAYLDGWTLEQVAAQADTMPVKAIPGLVEQALYAGHGYLIHSSSAELVVRQVEMEPSLLVTLPPTDQSSWSIFRQQMETYERDFAAADFQAMVAQFEGPEWRVQGATLRNLRLDGDGFRFVLDLQPGFTVSGSNGPDLSGLPAGEYAVTLSEGTFAVQPLTPAHVTIELAVDNDQDSLNILRAHVANEGLADLLSVRPAFAQTCSGPPQEVEGEAFDLYGQASEDVSVLLPPGAGESCVVAALLLDGDGKTLAENRIEVPSVGNSEGLAGQVLRASSGGGEPIFPFLLLGLLGALFSTLVAVAYRRGVN